RAGAPGVRLSRRRDPARPARGRVRVRRRPRAASLRRRGHAVAEVFVAGQGQRLARAGRRVARPAARNRRAGDEPLGLPRTRKLTGRYRLAGDVRFTLMPDGGFAADSSRGVTCAVSADEIAAIARLQSAGAQGLTGPMLREAVGPEAA